MTPGADIVVQDLAKTFAGPVPALDSVSFEAAAGVITAIVGPSGSGKTTLLRILGGLEDPTVGHASIGGRAPEELRRAKEVGWMAQAPALLPWNTVAANVELAQAINPRPDRAVPTPRELIEMVGLADFADALPGTLSGGMQQRAALARTLAIGAPLWLLDEPFSSLDELTRESVAADVHALAGNFRPTVLWVTHSVSEAVTLAERVVVLSPRPGRVVGVVDLDGHAPRPESSREHGDAARAVRHLLRAPGERLRAVAP